jgi:hypothetical protein
LNEGQITVVEEERSVQSVEGQVKKIQDLMKSVMHDGTHFGVIPGTSGKPSLFKAGAEKLCFVFRLAPEFEVERDDLPGGHREYRVKCVLRNLASGGVVGEGVGSCSSMESKYRYRNGSDYEVTGDPIPKDSKEKKQEYRKQGFGMKKVDGEWVWVRYTDTGKVDNPDIADVYNTVLKMAKKRAHVDATITACAASDIFTQDVEDFAEEPPMRRVDNEDPVPFNLKPEAPARSALDLRALLGKLATDPMLIEDGKAKIAAMLAKPEASAEELAELVERTERFLEKVKGKKEGK